MRKGLLAIGLGFALVASSVSAQRMLTPRASRGPELRGIPASVTSPRTDGSLRGIPGSVTDPRAASGIGFHGSFTFGNVHGPFFRHHRATPIVAVPYYAYPYPYYYDDSAYEQPQAAPQPQPQVIIIKDETSRSDDRSRYGEHSFDEDSREPAREAQPRPDPAPENEDPGPMTTLVYRDGHKSEVRNYAIVGENLLDLTKSPVMKKIPLASLDLEATRRENEENGVDFHP